MDWTARIGRRLKTRDLHVVLAVAENGSMSKAAEALAVSHPVISKTVSELEQVLRVRLFDRGPRGIEPTMYGRALVKTAAATIDNMRQGLKEIEFLKDSTVGELRVGCPEAIAAGLMPAVVERFRRQYPRVSLDVIHADTVTGHYRELREREVELLIGRLRTPFAEDDLAAELLLDEQLLIVAGAANPWTRKRKVLLQDLLDDPWVLPPSTSLPGMLGAEIFRAAGLELPRAAMTTLSIHLTASLLADGPFLGTLPGSMIRFSAQRLLLQKLAVELPPQVSSVGILTLKNRTLSPLAQRFIACSREVSAPLGHAPVTSRRRKV